MLSSRPSRSHEPRSATGTEELITVHGPGEFTGEATLLSGRRSLVTARAAEAGEVIELSREELLALIQTDAELGEILLRAFILRRVELIAHGLGDAVLLGSAYSAGTMRIREERWMALRAMTTWAPNFSAWA